MRCYGVLPTGFEQGFIEVVPDAVPKSKLQKETGTITGVCATDLCIKYFQKYNKGKAFENARVIFRKSSAGYAVATSALGVADRHPGNIVVQTHGHFFHINFGHFLGKWKVKREDGSFHFSPACAQTIGEGDERRQFGEEAKRTLEILSACLPGLEPCVIKGLSSTPENSLFATSTPGRSTSSTGTTPDTSI
jgi:phosphatidylinositol-4,5-bisphosphate 3-kinase